MTDDPSATDNLDGLFLVIIIAKNPGAETPGGIEIVPYRRRVNMERARAEFAAHLAKAREGGSNAVGYVFRSLIADHALQQWLVETDGTLGNHPGLVTMLVGQDDADRLEAASKATEEAGAH